MAGAALAAGALLCAAPDLAATPDDESRLTKRVQAIMESTTLEWTAAFKVQGRTYAAPRVVMLSLPVGHPARGAGYAAGLGVMIDLNDMAALDAVFDESSVVLAGVLIAHEVGHHVQVLNGRAVGGTSGVGRELQADCYAGWWLSRANTRSPIDYPLPNLDRRLPEMLSLLSALQSGRLSATSEADIHGAIPQRLDAVRQGMASEDPEVCGRSIMAP